MPLRLYNTLTRSVEPFEPADGKTVRMYTCGPTVYNPAHIGNFRTFLFEDLLRRVLRLHGWEVIQVMNLTDVDDKIIKRAHEQGKTITQVTDPVTEIFHQDRKYLRIEDAEVYPTATGHIAEMISLVERLLAKGIAYKADDGSVYFAISRFPGYGRLSRLDTREIKTGARVAQDDYTKENAQDFALWKAAKDEDEATGAAWDAPAPSAPPRAARSPAAAPGATSSQIRKYQTTPRPSTPGRPGGRPADYSSWYFCFSALTTYGSASVLVSPSARPSAMSRRSRRMILPLRVFGSSAA